jgi:hypothetical protein
MIVERCAGERIVPGRSLIQGHNHSPQ